jgi:sulfoxide reductase catalytic subunit YedY
MMNDRRQFMRSGLSLFFGAGILLNPLFSLIRRVYAEAQKLILPKATERETLIGKNPRLLDTRNLEVTPLEDFGTMGPTDHEIDLDDWRLEISGDVSNPVSFSYQALLDMPSIQRDVLLICPGVFANHGRWKGVSIRTLLETAGIRQGATFVTVHGPPTPYTKTKTFPINDIKSNTVFLAYRVNGEVLPQRHGFPLRAVADGYYGHDWVKYVYRITVDRA